MRPLLLLATLALFCACPSDPAPPSNDAGTPPGQTPASHLPPELKPPSNLELERPPDGSGLPNNLKATQQ
ncbi:hypothetical protein F0U60_19520 [Archangium minus]|uniref:Lipoprotein n=1 Tax=Archangium minus TaxID=83450 RepID=A0ABY9WV88_9BACT|nr:hypothetical protein F0U61_19620 [Archangium violaceum]WNG46057.1 hypothetical protein F0U60_19520 [Archangium minus]